MSSGKDQKQGDALVLGRLPEILQLGTRVYRVLVDGIVSGRFESGAPLRPDTIARQLEVSTTPVREALHRLEGDGLAVKLPNQGWFVREHSRKLVQELYELRAALECFGTRLACQRATEDEIAWLRGHQAAGHAALDAGDMDAYRIYNHELHAAIITAAENSYLSGMMGQLRLQSEMLMVKTIRIAGRPERAMEEHERLIDLIAARDAARAERAMERHILTALDEIIQLGCRPENQSGESSSANKAGGNTPEELLARSR